MYGAHESETKLCVLYYFYVYIRTFFTTSTLQAESPLDGLRQEFVHRAHPGRRGMRSGTPGALKEHAGGHAQRDEPARGSHLQFGLHLAKSGRFSHKNYRKQELVRSIYENVLFLHQKAEGSSQPPLPQQRAAHTTASNGVQPSLQRRGAQAHAARALVSPRGRRAATDPLRGRAAVRRLRPCFPRRAARQTAENGSGDFPVRTSAAVGAAAQAAALGAS